MRALTTALGVEFLKLRRTLALWMVLIAPLVVAMIQVFLFMQGASVRAEFDPWRFLVGNNFGIWVILMLPLFITLETALLANLDHTAKGWKHLYAQPVPRWTHIAAKLIVAAGIVATSIAVMVLLIFLTGVTLDALNVQPNADFSGGMPWGRAITAGSLMFLASLLMIAIHSWIALRWHNFALASGIGMAATVIGFFVVNSERFAPFFPWSTAINAISPLIDRGEVQIVPLLWGALGGIAAAVIGGWDILRRDVL